MTEQFCAISDPAIQPELETTGSCWKAALGEQRQHSTAWSSGSESEHCSCGAWDWQWCWADASYPAGMGEGWGEMPCCFHSALHPWRPAAPAWKLVVQFVLYMCDDWGLASKLAGLVINTLNVAKGFFMLSWFHLIVEQENFNSKNVLGHKTHRFGYVCVLFDNCLAW